LETKGSDMDFNYKEYRKHLDELMADNKTTGPNQDDWLVDYARLNIQRMKRWENTWQPEEKQEELLLSIETPMTWLTLTEGWCGDAAQIIPIIDKLAQVNPLIEHKLVLRDENPALMDKFLTDGARAIPKTIFIDTETQLIYGSWGPRPRPARDLLKTLMDKKELPKEAIYSHLHAWYARDKGNHTAREFLQHLAEALVRREAGTPINS